MTMNKTHLLKRIRELSTPLSPLTVDYQEKLIPLSDIRCVAFDFYGTMFISDVGDIGIDEEDQEKSRNSIKNGLKAVGFTLTKKKAGKRGKELFENTINTYITAAKNNGIDYPETDIREIWWEVLSKLMYEQYIRGELTKESSLQFGIEYEFRMNNIWPSPNLSTLLQNLLKNERPLGIISNSQYYTPLAFEAFLEHSPEEFGFDRDLLLWSYKTGFKKPSQNLYHIFLEEAEQQGIAPQQILYIGNDIYKDIYPAKTLGMHTGLYIGDKRSIRHEAEDLQKEKYQPDLIINDIQQVSEALNL